MTMPYLLAPGGGQLLFTGAPKRPLLLPPSIDWNFLASEVLPSRITPGGGANGTRVNSAGLIVAASCPRFDYDPVTLQPRGLLREEARTNILLNSLLNGTNLSTQSVAVTAQAYTLSFYGTGSVTLSGAHTAVVAGTGAYPARKTLTFTPSAGSLTLTVAGDVKFAQLEAGAFGTSFIPTAGATVTRSADALLSNGTNFSSWFNPLEGTILFEMAYFHTYTGSPFPRLVHIVETASPRQAIELLGYAQMSSGEVYFNNASQFSATGAPSGRMALAYKANNVAMSVNGSVPVTDTSVTLPTAPVQMALGYFAGGAAHSSGHINLFRYYRRRVPNAALQALAA